MTLELNEALAAFERAERMCYASASSLELAADAGDPLMVAGVRLAAAVAGTMADYVRDTIAELNAG